MNDIAIKCRGIKKHYGNEETRVDALKGIDVDVRLGELTILEGPSGSGKSTLLSIITTILTPDAGQFCLKYLGIVFQSLFLIPTLSVLENVSLPLLVAGANQKEASEKAMETLKKMKIDHKAENSPSDLSKGQQQKVAISRAIINESKILVCDEPTSALDQHSGHDTMEILKELSRDSKAVLVVTHDHRIFSFADRIISMSDGLITSGSAA
jgi:putative ABC transport system ATP-binding protein